MHSPPADAPIPLLPRDQSQARSGDLQQISNNASKTSLLDEDTSAKTPRPTSRVSSPTYPPNARGQQSAFRMGGRARVGSTRVVTGFGSRSRTSLRHALYLLLERPTSSNSAFVLHFVTNVIILLSAFLTVLETLPFFHTVNTALWFGLETAVVVLFTVEYVARSVAWGFGERDGGWKRWWNWATSFFALIDLFSILPYYIELALSADTTAFFRFSILRTFRLLRVFRPFRYSSTILLTIEVMILSTRRSKHALLALSFFVSMAMIVFSTLLYFAERGTWDDALETFVDAEGVRSQFESIPAAAWFVLVTITTVGYGEIIPRSFLGRLITIPLLLFGLLLVALPSFVLGREFAVVWEEMSAGVLDGFGLGNEPDSPTTPFTGRDAAAYGVLPDELEESAPHPPRSAHARMESRDTNDDGDDDDDATTPLTGAGRKSKNKGKGHAGHVLFDSSADDEERGVGASPGRTPAYTFAPSSSLPTLGLGVAAAVAVSATAAATRRIDREREKMVEREKRRELVDSTAQANTGAFMGLHRRNVSAVNVGATGVVAAGAVGELEKELRELLKELKGERDALRWEREALRVERDVLARERELLRERTSS